MVVVGKTDKQEFKGTIPPWKVVMYIRVGCVLVNTFDATDNEIALRFFSENCLVSEKSPFKFLE